MDPISPDIDPIEALRALRSLNVEYARATEQPFDGLDTELSKFRSVVENLGNGRPARPPIMFEEYRGQWREYCAAKRNEIEPRAERFLCWDPEVAVDLRFQQYLDRTRRELSARSLQGLVRSCHIRWSPQFAQGAVAARVRQRLRKYDGPNRVIGLWKSHPEMVLGSRAHHTFAELLTSGQKAVQAACEFWKFDEGTLYIREAVKEALAFCLARSSEHSPFNRYAVQELLGWTKWPEGEFREQVASAILSGFAGTDFTDKLKRLVLNERRLGDPRLPRNRTNWVGLGEAERRFTEWLSKDDIVFFFEHVLPQGKDPHGRKKFWLHYVKRIVRSRPLLSTEDRARLQGSKDKVGHFGRIEGDTSAFMLDFGRLIVVEFSKINNACYLYEQAKFAEVVKDFWAPTAFRVVDLKDKSKSFAQVFHSNGWYQKMLQILAKNGVRPSE